MYTSYPVTFYGKEVGRVEIIEQGIYTCLSCRCTINCRDVARLVSISGEKVCHIGVLMPNGTALELTKRLSKTAFCALELSENSRFEIHTDNMYAPPPGWQPCTTMAKYFSDPEIKAVCADIDGGLCSSDSKETLLAVPLREHEPFPLMPIFCFGAPQDIGGSMFLVFHVKNGRLIV